MNFRRITRVGVVLCGAALTPSALSQAPPNVASASATLPESNEAMLLASQVENAIERADFRLAIRLIEQIMRLPAELVAAPGVQTLYPVRTQAVWLLRRLPAEGVEVFRELHDAEAAARFEEARQAGDTAALRELFRLYPISGSWPDIGRELAALLLDRGQFGEAIEVLRELTAGGAPETPERRAQLAAALASIGARGAAERLADGLVTEAAQTPGSPLEIRAIALRDWLVTGSVRANPASGGSAFAPALRAGDAWSQAIAAGIGGEELETAAAAPDATEVFRAWPLHRPALSDGTLVVRVSGNVSAFDGLTLAPLWSTPEIEPELVGDSGERWQPLPRAVRINMGGNPAAMLTEFSLLLSHALRHDLTAGGGRVYSVESLQLVDDGSRGFPRRGFGFDDTGAIFANQLVARDLRSGVLLWRAGGDAGDPLNNCAFQAPPLVLGERLLVPVQRGAALLLCELEPATGKLVRELPLIGPPTEFPVTGGRCFIVADETALYVATGNGIVCAVGRDNLEWRWATIYPSTIGERLGVQWWQPTPQTPGEEYFVAPVLADDLLVLAPVDSRDLFALDRFSGLERWRRPVEDDHYIVGSADQGLILAGSRIYCIDAVDGKTLRWQSVPLEVSGSPALRDGHVYVPTQTGLVVIDARSGKVVDDQAGNAAHPPVLPSLALANLIVADEALFSVSPTTVAKYPDPERLARQCERILAEAPGDPRPQLALAWAALLTGGLDRALATLETLKPADAALAMARDRLLGEVLLALAVKSGDEGERLAWLRRAAEMASSPEVAVRVAALTGRTLEEAGRWAEALTHYAGLIKNPPPGLRQDSDDRALWQASWVFSIERVRSLLPRLSAGDGAEGLRRFIDAVIREGRAAALRRVRAVAPQGPQTALIDAAFALAKPPPELAIVTLPATDPPELSPADAGRLQLERCEVHVALGRAAEARADLDDWRRRFASDGAPRDPEEQRHLEHLDTAIRKLEIATLPPFEPECYRQWRIPNAELMLDPRSPLSAASRSAFVVRATDKYEAALIRAFDALSLRRWPYELKSDENRHLKLVNPAEQLALEMGQQEDVRRFAWPMIIYDNLAVMPVPHGVVCVGLGVERHGGQRLWEFAVPDWIRAPETFTDRSVGSPSGFAFCPRGNRVVLLDWLDGTVRWQRDLPGRTVRRLEFAADRLVVLTEDQRVLTVDHETGRELSVLPAVAGSAREVWIVGDTLVLLGESTVVGLAVDTFEKRWSESCGGVSGFAPIYGREWFAYRDKTGNKWRVRRAADGQPAVPGELEEPGEFTALCATEDALLTAARRSGGSEGSNDIAIVAEIDLATGVRRWTHPFETSAAINLTQLAAHPRFVPVLIAPRNEDRGGNDAAMPSIRLIAKVSGEMTDPVGVGNIVRKTGACGMALLVSPTRMVVQAHGNLFGYGQTADGASP